MKKEEKRVDFDLSNLSLKELIEVYEEIDSFLDYLNDNKIKEDNGDADE